jgi:hypothetical protein
LPVWRAGDEALLSRLEDEIVLAELWRAESNGGPAPHARAAGMISLLRKREGGEAAIAQVVQQILEQRSPIDVSALRALTRATPLAGVDPQLLHMLAVFHGRVADALARSAPAPAVALYGRSMAAWLALGSEKSYLERSIRAVLGESSSQGSIDQAITDALQYPMRELGTRARRGARDLDADALTAMRALAQVPQACRIAGIEPRVASKMEAYAERQRAQAIEEALAPIGVALGESKALGKAEQRAAELIGRVVRVWHWSDRDEHVERYAVDEFTAIAWNLYHQPGYEPIRGLIAPMEPLIDSLADRVENNPANIAYAAPCATMLMFRSDCSTTLEEQRRHAERSVAICPPHKNGRITLANVLCHEVRNRLDRGLLPAAERATLLATLDRAQELWPDTKGVSELRQRLDRIAWWG